MPALIETTKFEAGIGWDSGSYYYCVECVHVSKMERYFVTHCIVMRCGHFVNLLCGIQYEINSSSIVDMIAKRFANLVDSFLNFLVTLHISAVCSFFLTICFR